MSRSRWRTWLLICSLLLLGALRLGPILAAGVLINRGALSCTKESVELGNTNMFSIEVSAALDELQGCGDALQNFQTATRYHPHSTSARRWQVYAEIFRGNAKHSYDLLQTESGKHFSDRWFKFMRGLTAHLIGDSTESVREWVQLDRPELVLQGIGDRLLGVNKIDDALAYYGAIDSINDSWWDAHLKSAEILWEAGRFDEALLHYELGFRLLNGPSRVSLPEAAYHYGLILIRQERYAEAIVPLKQAVTWHPYPIYTAQLGEVYGLMGDDGLAEYWLDETVRLAPNSGYAYWAYGNYYQGRKRHEEAVKQFEQAIRVEPQAPAYYYGNLGAAYLAVGDADQAIEALQDALQRDPDNTTYSNWLDAAMTMRNPDK